MKWSDLQPGFCEGIISGPPEIFNSVSSIVMVFYGLCGIFATRNNNTMLRVISSMLAVCGVGSIVYHATMHFGWGIVDSMPMLISSYIGAYMCVDIIIYKRFFLDNITNKDDEYHLLRRYEKISGVIALIFSTMLIFAIALSSAEETAHLFSIWFLISELIIGVSVFVIRYVTHRLDDDPANDQEFIKAFKIMYGGFGCAIIAAIFWFTTESLCKENTWLRYLQAHSIWHICISIGMYFLMQFMVFINNYNKKLSPYWVKGETIPQKIFYALVPSVGNANEVSHFDE